MVRLITDKSVAGLWIVVVPVDDAFDRGDEPAERWRLLSDRSSSSVLADRLIFITDGLILCW